MLIANYAKSHTEYNKKRTKANPCNLSCIYDLVGFRRRTTLVLRRLKIIILTEKNPLWRYFKRFLCPQLVIKEWKSERN